MSYACFYLIQSFIWLHHKLTNMFMHTFAAGLIQAVRAKTAGLHVAWREHNSGAKSARKLFKRSKGSASLLVCFWFWVSDFLWV